MLRAPICTTRIVITVLYYICSYVTQELALCTLMKYVEAEGSHPADAIINKSAACFPYKLFEVCSIILCLCLLNLCEKMDYGLTYYTL